jgi:hypothetical protein
MFPHFDLSLAFNSTRNTKISYNFPINVSSTLLKMNHNNVPTLTHQRNAERYLNLYLTLSANENPTRISNADTVNREPVHQESGFDISHLAASKITYALQHAWADSTIKKYNSGIKIFIDFCNREHIPIPYRLPASEFLLCAFAATDTGVLAGTTAQN